MDQSSLLDVLSHCPKRAVTRCGPSMPFGYYRRFLARGFACGRSVPKPLTARVVTAGFLSISICEREAPGRRGGAPAGAHATPAGGGVQFQPELTR
ncbi:hypothetical protein EVAR_33052_1 [Eumeta japonica]|uniref:Uncharacterized protein n=1 Tax=Eumeta variegata TaxID=151549 RepID=A0A4C1WUL8_EUMVA|nr:hypothetical protein EVAR_33052_1 [Eumeta japonica]